MKRFIDLGTQISETREFAWYDTVTDVFESFGDSQTWQCWADFAEDYAEQGGRDLSRYQVLCPSWVFEAPSWRDG